jgi:multidrug efflux pump subunit AcrA (membrane-fusion protein)
VRSTLAESAQGIKGIQKGTSAVHKQKSSVERPILRVEGVFARSRSFSMGSASISIDEFQALEQKVLQTVELIKREREARAAAEAEVAAVKTELAARTEELESRGQEIVALRQELATAGDANAEVQTLQREREAVRLRVEKMLASIDEII